MSDIINVLTRNTTKNNLFTFLDLVNYKKFSEKIFEIPVFQRKYVWTQEIVKDFLSEVEKEFENKFLNVSTNDFPIFLNNDKDKKVCANENFIGDDIFFGTIYWVESNNINKIIDGHQRILTWFLILLASFRIINKTFNEKNKIVKNKEYKFKELFNGFHKLLRSWLFKVNKQFNNDDIYSHFADFVLIDQQKDDKKSLKYLFKIIFRECENIDEIEKFIKEIKKEKRENQTKKNNKKIDETTNISNINIEILDAYLQIEKFILNCVKKTKKENVIKKHDFLSDNVNNILSKNEHIEFTVISWLIYKSFNKFKFAIFEISSINKASQTFETINGKGMQLTRFDIIKNDLYEFKVNKSDFEKEDQKTKEEIDFNNKIEIIEEKIKYCYGSLKKSDNFLLDLFKSCYSIFLNEKKFFDIKKNNLNSKFREIASIFIKKNEKNFLNFSNDFLTLSLNFLNKYEDLFINFKINKKIWRNVISSLNLLKYDSIKIILICMLMENDKKYMEENFENKIYRYIEKIYKYYLLNLTVGNKQSNVFKNHFKRIMYFVGKYGLKKFFDFIENYKENENNENTKILYEFHSDIDNYFENEKIKTVFQDVIKRSYKETEIIKWYLHNIIITMNKDDNSTLEELTLEHVLPKEHKEWKEKDPFWKDKQRVEFENNKYKLGNCLLLTKGDNAGVSNNLFLVKYNNLKDKKLIYLTKDRELFDDCSFLTIGHKKENWTEEIIRKRNEVIEKKLSDLNIFLF